MHLFVRSIAILALAAAAVACADAPSQPQPPIDQQVRGEWVMQNYCGADPPCTGAPELTLFTIDSVIAGNLRWPVWWGDGTDTVAVTGVFRGRSVEFDIAPIFSEPWHFSGWVDFAGRLSGELSAPSVAGSGRWVAFQKQE